MRKALYRSRSLLLAACMLMVVGCGSAKQSEPKSAQPAPAAPAAAPSAQPQPDKPPAQPIKVTIGVPVATIAYAPVYAAAQGGIFKKHGVEVDVKTVTGGLEANAALLAGEFHLLANTPTEFLKLTQKGEPVLAVQNMSQLVTQDLIVSKKFIQDRNIDPKAPLKERIQKMKGARIGAVSLGGTSELLTRWLFQYAGLDGKKDMEAIRIGGGPALLAALKTNQIDGFLLSPPAGPQAVAEGVGVVLVAGSEVPDFQNNIFTVTYTTQKYAKENAAALRAVVTALAEASELLVSDPVKGAAMIRPALGNVDPKLLDESMVAVKTAFGNQGKMSASQWQNAIKLNREAGTLTGDLTVSEGKHWTNEYFK